MPCESPGANALVSQAKTAKINHLTQMLCGLCEQIDRPLELKDGPVMPSIDIVPNLQAWWTQHKLDDEERLTEQRARVDRADRRLLALTKLTTEEREVLGL